MVLLMILFFTILGSAIPAADVPDVVLTDEVPISLDSSSSKPSLAKIPCPRRCKSTCTRPNPRNCSPSPSCSCQLGYVFQNSQSNTCIPIYTCPQNAGCNGDINAEIQSPVIGCPSTCQNPDQSNCNKKNKPVDCVCKSGYILSQPGGRCIRPNRCPCGNPCRGGNRTYVNCKIVCPINYCPIDDSQVFYPCDPVWPCPGGCVCKSGYKLTNGQCVLPQDCPPVTCTRPNEEWDSCPPTCYSDNCYDVPNWSQPCDNNDPFSCVPQCRCQPDFARGNDGTCIPVDQCPP